MIMLDTGKEQILSLLEQVTDPELPVLSVVDLGIIRDIQMFKTPAGEDAVSISITPTYSGCPAMDVISMQVRMLLLEHGFKKVVLTTVLSPAWTTDWMSEAGKEKLQAYGIAPPAMAATAHTELFAEADAVACPHCQSANTRLVSQFGSTACKALYQCNHCQEPFDYFKCH